MQLAHIASTSALVPVATPILAPGTAASQSPATPAAPRFAPAPATAPAAIEGAVDGVARLGFAGTTPIANPIVDFPGIKAGDEFDIVKGSKAGMIGVRGEANILTFEPEHATFHVRGGRFGFKVDVTVDIEQIDSERVRITSRGEGIPDTTEIGRIVEQRTNYAKFVQDNDASKETIISHDGNGTLTIDTAVPKFDHAHLILVRR